jgi:death-on-curing protein
VTEATFLTVDELLEIHDDMIERYGGSPGLRDQGLLESAAAAPAASFGGNYLHADLFEMAAALLFSLVQNHPFIDGNKRVGAAAALIFLRMNDVPLNAPEGAMTDLVLDVASGVKGRDAVEAFFRSHA